MSLRAACRYSSAHRVRAAYRVNPRRHDLAGVATLPNDGLTARRGFKHALVQEVTRGWVNRVRSRGGGLAPARPAVVRFTPRTGCLNLWFLGRWPAVVGAGFHAAGGLLPRSQRGLKGRSSPPVASSLSVAAMPSGCQATHGRVCRVGSRGRDPAPVACIRGSVVGMDCSSSVVVRPLLAPRWGKPCCLGPPGRRFVARTGPVPWARRGDLPTGDAHDG